MRLDTPVFFQTLVPGPYDPTTGNYGPDTLIEHKRYASVTASANQTLRLVYGKLRRGSQTLRLQNHFTGSFDRIRIGGKLYRVDLERRYRLRHVMIISEAAYENSN